jgi:hypothetical protein
MLVGLVNETLHALDFPTAGPRRITMTIGLPLEEAFQRALPSAANNLAAVGDVRRRR